MPKLTTPKPIPKPRPTRSKAPRRNREQHWSQTGAVVAGIDEVGRGSWAGPLVSAAVVLKPDCELEGVRDSKLMTPIARERSVAAIREQSIAVGIGTVKVAELNEKGLAWGLEEAGIRALQDLSIPPQRVLLDGHHDYFDGQFECETIVGGDATELCIAAASVIAKVHRDTIMKELETTHPGYGFADHKGYGTAAHRTALEARGPSDAHRSQWKPIAELLQARLNV